MVDLDAIQAELTYIADRAKDVAYRGDTEWLTSVWASVGQHVPRLLAEVRELRQQLAALQDDGRRTCPVCGDRFMVTKAGKMRHHNGDQYVGGWRTQCEGTGQLPSEAVTHSGGET